MEQVPRKERGAGVRHLGEERRWSIKYGQNWWELCYNFLLSHRVCGNEIEEMSTNADAAYALRLIARSSDSSAVWEQASKKLTKG
jgi:hypothetical protein